MIYPEFAFYYVLLGLVWVTIIGGWLLFISLAIAVIICRSRLGLAVVAVFGILLFYATP